MDINSAPSPIVTILPGRPTTTRKKSMQEAKDRIVERINSQRSTASSKPARKAAFLDIASALSHGPKGPLPTMPNQVPRGWPAHWPISLPQIDQSTYNAVNQIEEVQRGSSELSAAATPIEQIAHEMFVEPSLPVHPAERPKVVSFSMQRHNSRSMPDLLAGMKKAKQEISMAVFEIALAYVLQNEGKTYVNDPLDHGGMTRYGICQATLSSYLGRAATESDIKNISPSMVHDVYRRNYWNVIRADQINDQSVATAFLDMAVLCGTTVGTRMVQSSVQTFPDGFVGPITIDAINRAQPAKLLSDISLRACTYFSAIAVKDPTQVKFLAGWQIRAHRLLTINAPQNQSGTI